MTTTPYVPYRAEQPWLPFSEVLLDWDEAFHQLMLNDHIRMAAYKAAIDDTVKPGDTVLDLGTGTGILSLWALQAGADKVYGIEMDPDILATACDLMNKNGYGNRFVPINDLSFHVNLPEKVDVLVSEIMGNMGDNEDFQPILNDAIKRFLKPKGSRIPIETSSYIVPVAAGEAHAAIASGNVSTINEKYNLESLIHNHGVDSRFDLYYDTIIPGSTYLSRPTVLKHYRSKWNQSPVYKERRVFDIERDGDLTGFKAFFIASLSSTSILDISGDDISSRETSDSWKHAFLPIENPIAVKRGDKLYLEFGRFYCLAEDGSKEHFRQVYQWSGRVERNGHGNLGTFKQCMRGADKRLGSDDALRNTLATQD